MNRIRNIGTIYLIMAIITSTSLFVPQDVCAYNRSEVDTGPFGLTRTELGVLSATLPLAAVVISYTVGGFAPLAILGGLTALPVCLISGFLGITDLHTLFGSGSPWPFIGVYALSLGTAFAGLAPFGLGILPALLMAAGTAGLLIRMFDTFVAPLLSNQPKR